MEEAQNAENIFQQQRDIGKLWAELREFRAETEGKFHEIMTILIGPTGENGMRADIKSERTRVDRIKNEMDVAIAWGKDVWEVKRYQPGGCVGIIALDVFKAEHEKERAARKYEVMEMKKARLTMVGGLCVALVMSLGPIVVELIKK